MLAISWTRPWPGWRAAGALRFAGPAVSGFPHSLGADSAAPQAGDLFSAGGPAIGPEGVKKAGNAGCKSARPAAAPTQPKSSSRNRKA